MNSPRAIIPIESTEFASSVIKSLRVKSSANKRLNLQRSNFEDDLNCNNKQNQELKNYENSSPSPDKKSINLDSTSIVHSLTDFDRIILANQMEFNQNLILKQKENDLLKSISNISINDSLKNNSKIENLASKLSNFTIHNNYVANENKSENNVICPKNSIMNNNKIKSTNYLNNNKNKNNNHNNSDDDSDWGNSDPEDDIIFYDVIY